MTWDDHLDVSYTHDCGSLIVWTSCCKVVGREDHAWTPVAMLVDGGSSDDSKTSESVESRRTVANV